MAKPYQVRDVKRAMFVARCVEFPGLGAHGRSQEEALRQIKVAVAGALKWLSDEKREAPSPWARKNSAAI